MLPARSVLPVRNRYGVSSLPVPAPEPVRKVSFWVKPDGTPVWTIQNRRSQLAPALAPKQPWLLLWVLGTMKLQSPSASETQVAQESVTAVVGPLDVPSYN